MREFSHEPQLEDYYVPQAGTYNYQQYRYDLECYHSPTGTAACDEFDPWGRPWDPTGYDGVDSASETNEKISPKEENKITPELQARIDKARAEIKARKKDSQWGAICVATKDLIEGNHKIAARNLIQTYLKAHQR